MISLLILELSDPFKIVVENRLKTISPYIFLEQETWFEADAALVRAFLRADMRVIDIGANCGFYTLLAAEKVGPKGHVWAFEPGLTSSRLLQESLRINGFSNVTFYEAAAGPAPGVAWFQDADCSELSLVVSAGALDARQIRVESLDNLHATGEINDIDFIKVDAEGFETEVIQGGLTFFKFENPLIMLEVISTHAEEMNLDAAERLKEMGYRYYRYLPGAGGLAPFVPDKLGDFILNIFLCKPDRENTMRAQGFLATEEDLRKSYPAADPGLFIRYFAQLSVVRSCPELFTELHDINATDDGYLWICAEFLMATDKGLPLAERVVRLRRAEDWIDANFHLNRPLEQMLSFIRIWAACGRSKLILGLLNTISHQNMATSLKIAHPFLTVSAEWDNMPVRGDLEPWLQAMVAIAFEMVGSLSSYWDHNETVKTYNLARQSGYANEALERRAALCALVRNQSFPKPLFINGPMSRNQDLWNEIAKHLASVEKI